MLDQFEAGAGEQSLILRGIEVRMVKRIAAIRADRLAFGGGRR